MRKKLRKERRNFAQELHSKRKKIYPLKWTGKIGIRDVLKKTKKPNLIEREAKQRVKSSIFSQISSQKR